MKKYIIDLQCNNCGKKKHLEIEPGTTVKETLQNEVCDNCNCKNTFIDKCDHLWIKEKSDNAYYCQKCLQEIVRDMHNEIKISRKGI